MKELLITVAGGVIAYMVVSGLRADAEKRKQGLGITGDKYGIASDSEQANMLFDQEMEFML